MTLECKYVVIEVRKGPEGRRGRVVASFVDKCRAKLFDRVANETEKDDEILGYGWCAADKISHWAECYSTLIES